MNLEGWQCPPKPDLDRKVKFSCPILDDQLGPSIRAGNILELCGEAGSAKTQFCLHLALETVRQHNDNRVLYVVTERAFPSKRVEQILASNKLSEGLLDRIIIKNVRESVSSSLIYDFLKNFNCIGSFL